MQTTRKLYQIYTEDKNRYTVQHIVSREFQGFSIINASGYYKGEREDAVIIEIIGDCSIDDDACVLRFELEKVRRVSQIIKEHNEQECVLITISTIKVEEV